ncbi:uncharacterized protein [Argopecten irradians]|uniref:uncharacterized protein n=1 Tax=Argopecten irradians TaxID=31199 RepID=UPI003719D636
MRKSHDSVVSGDVELPANGDDEALVTEAIVENIDNRNCETSLPACPPPTCSAQAHSTDTVSPGAFTVGQSPNDMADFRRMFTFLQQQMSGFIPKQTPTVHQTENTDGLDDLDNFVNDEAVASDVEPTSQDIISDLSDFFDTEDKCGPNISEGLASAVSKSFRVKISKEKRKALLELHKRPGNCSTLKTPRVNKAVWQSMTRNARDLDVGLQILQSTACSLTIFGGDISECMKLAMDSFKLIQIL